LGEGHFLHHKDFAAGVDAFENLTSPCLKEHPWEDFPFSGFVAMCIVMRTLMVDTYATTMFCSLR